MSSQASQPLTLLWKGERIAVSSVEQALPAQPDASSLSRAEAAGSANPAASLPVGAWRAVARAATHPEAVAVTLRPTPQEPVGLLLDENVEGATLRTFNTRVWMSELLPGIQPRTGMEVLDVSDPQVVGTTEGGEPCAVVRYHYRDLEHLKDHVRQTVHGTLALNTYAQSILSRKVTRPLITHPVEFTFDDGTEPFHALVVRDGITRLASAWSVLAGPDADASEAADLMVDALFGKVPAPSPAGGPALAERLASRRANQRVALAKEFTEAMAGPEPAARGVQIAQTYVVPAQIAVGVEGHPGHLLAAEDVFDDAMRSILASVHVEFKAWDAAAQNVEVATRALKRVIQLGNAQVGKESLQVVYGLAVGRTDPADLAEAYGAADLPGTALWRGIQLVHGMTRPELYEPLKDQAKIIKGGSRMSSKGFAELLGPIMDLPWRSAKKAVSKQARNAWGNGGVLARDVLKEWDPVFTDDFTTLVEPALLGDVDARCTLAVAGGIALIADKLLTRNVGSSLMAAKEKGGVPFRSDVHLIVENLSAEGNELGLWTLALAANRFREDGLPENAQPVRQLVRRDRKDEGAAPYVHLKVDLTQPDRTARDENGVPVPMYEWDVVWASDEERARKTYAEHTRRLLPVPAHSPDAGEGADRTAGGEEGLGEAGGASSGEKPGEAAFGGPGDAGLGIRRAPEFRRALRAGLEDAQDALASLAEIDRTAGSWPPAVESGDFEELRQSVLKIQTDLENLRRAIQGDDPDLSAEADDEES